MTRLDNANLWSEEQGKLYHHLMHTPEQIWKAGYEPQTQGEPREAAGAVLVGKGVALFAAELSCAFFPTCSVLEAAQAPPAAQPDNWLLVHVLEPGDAPLPEADAWVAPLGVALPDGAAAAFYDNTLPRTACLGSMLFSLAALLERCEIIDSAQALARPIVGMLMQKAGAVAVGLESELNMAKHMAFDLQNATPLIVPLSPELEPAAEWARMQMNRVAGLPAVSLTADDSRDTDVLAAYPSSQWRPVLLGRLADDGMPLRYGDLPDALRGAHTLYAEGRSELDAFFSLTYPLTMVAFYMHVLQTVEAG